jgi:hypothetical protein
MFTAWENLGKMFLASKLFLRRKSRKPSSRGKITQLLVSHVLKYAASLRLSQTETSLRRSLGCGVRGVETEQGSYVLC